ncbi:MAG: YkgJ family cysteine cluster protein [Halobacteriales archaeon]|nr:YkgJ family cysteine cluster protein [Halobacteriales archaeon]
MTTLEAELEAARSLAVDELADAIETIGFECTRCGACCRGEADDPHTATVFPDEVRGLQDATGYDWRDVARPMPFGLDADGGGETFEWALAADACGDCSFYDDGAAGEDGTCTVYADRPLICETYPFSVDLAGSTPMGAVVDAEGPVNAHECEGLGRDIDRGDAEALAATLKRRAVRELEEAIGVRDGYRRVDADGPIVHDSEGAKRPDGTPLER